MKTLTRQIEEAGGPQALSQELNISIQRLVNWRKRGRVPADMVLAFCRARRWTVTPHELRPDIYPNPIDGLPSSQLADLISDGVIKHYIPPVDTRVSGSGSLYSALRMERRREERREAERREQERRQEDRREGA